MIQKLLATMGSCLPPATAHHRCRHLVSQINSTTTISPSFLTSLYTHNEVTSNYIRTRRSFLLAASNPNRWSGRCRATSPGPPSPPKLDPPPTSGVMPSFSRAQDAARIFFAVLFWMSLFFWSCVWDGKNDGRPNNRSRFRR